MSLIKLRLSMVGTLAIIIGLSTAFFAVILSLVSSLSLITLGVLVVSFNIFQWLISPYIVDALYRVKEISEHENPKLHETVENLSRKSGIKKPRLMLAQIPIPNAFAYGSPLSGSRVAVTKGLLEDLEEEEVEAVIGHELGHLKHRDVQIMMFASILPAILYYIGYSLMWSSMIGRQREEGGSSALVAIVFIVFSWILNMFILYLSRLREYYADRHSVQVVEDGSRKLSEGLAKIVHSTRRKKINKQPQQINAFKALFITDPDHSDTDSETISYHVSNLSRDQALVQKLLSKKVTTLDRIVEVLSTHPNIVKRLKALKTLD